MDREGSRQRHARRARGRGQLARRDAPIHAAQRGGSRCGLLAKVPAMAGGGRVRTEPVHVARSRRGGCYSREVARGQPGGDGRGEPHHGGGDHAPLCRRPDGGGDGLRCGTAVTVRADGGGDATRCRTPVLVRADGDGDSTRCQAAGLVRADGGADAMRCRTAVSVWAVGDGDGTRCRTAVLIRADENRDGLRCRVGARDTVAFGRARRLRSAATRVLAGPVLRPVACGRRAVQGDGGSPEVAVTHAGCCRSTRLHHKQASRGENGENGPDQGVSPARDTAPVREDGPGRTTGGGQR